jgi:carboxyl-terminal processing protease
MNNYIGEVDENTLIDAAINGMYGCLSDEYTTYIDKDSTDSLQEQLGGKYTGVGIEITMVDNKIVINRVFSDSPAYEAGLKKGDVLTKLDGVDLSDKDPLYVSTNIKDNKEKDTFEITYLRDGEEYKTKLTKKLVLIDSVESEEYGEVGYLKISTFSSVTAKQVEDKLNKFSSNIKSIVIDLRDNTGGYLTAAYDISDLFVEKGKNIYQIKDRDEKISSHAASRNVVKNFKKIVVLVNENSASASEVVALALKESSNAIVVGVKTFGKGTVQETKTLKSGAMVKYTSAYWLSPNGNSINKIGITPDIKVEEVEKQLDEAIKAAK